MRTITIPNPVPRFEDTTALYAWPEWRDSAISLIPRNEGTMGALLSLSAKLNGTAGDKIRLPEDEFQLLAGAAMDARWNGAAVRAYGVFFDAVIRAGREE